MERLIKSTLAMLPQKEAYMKEIESIWETGILTNYGEKTDKFKKMLMDYTGYPNLDLFVNGHSALVLAIKAMKLKGEVITSPFTFVSTTNAIVQNGLTPVFGDIGDEYNLTPNSIEKLITSRTSAIITPHIFGIPCDVDAINDIAHRYHLKVIYDGAQAFGTKINGQAIGVYGDACIFSFHAIKVFHSIEGGMVAYRDGNLHNRFEQYRNFGITYGEEGTDVDVIGINAKMNEFQAAMGIVNLPELDHEIQRRKKIAELYCSLLDEIPGISTYTYKENVEYNYAYFPIKIEKEYGLSRDKLWLLLKENGIGTRKLYDKLTYDFNCYRENKFVKKSENAERIKRSALDLPIYGSLKEEDIRYICSIIKNKG